MLIIELASKILYGPRIVNHYPKMYTKPINVNWGFSFKNMSILARHRHVNKVQK